MTIGQRIKELRKMFGLTQKQLADACGIDDATLRKYENGKLNPKRSTLEVIANKLDINVDSLVGSNADCTTTMHNLFKAFNTYGGTLKNGNEIASEINAGISNGEDLYISFTHINALMYSWYYEYKKYLEKIKKAETIKDIEEKSRYIKDAEYDFQLWMIKYPESEPDKQLLHHLKALDEAEDFMGTHPLEDPESPASEEYKEQCRATLKQILRKLNDISSQDNTNPDK